MSRLRKIAEFRGDPVVSILIPLLLVCFAVQYTNCESDPTVPERVKFFHFSSPDNYQEVCRDGISSHLSSVKMRKDKPTFVIIDGFLSHLKSNMTQHVKNSVLASRPDCNVIVVDWNELSGYKELNLTEDTPFTDVMIVYDSVKIHVDFVGKKLAKFLGMLISADKVDLLRMHLIGYSLGAHIAGVAGRAVIKKHRERITRITGLDPAGPGFPLSDRAKRLDQTDAEFVDIYYTNRYTAGDTDQHVGHVDIYVNGGRTQPGCASTSLFNSTLCNHIFAWRTWNHCMREECLACKCSTVECKDDKIDNNFCVDDFIPVGMNISLDLTGDFFLETGDIKG